MEGNLPPLEELQSLLPSTRLGGDPGLGGGATAESVFAGGLRALKERCYEGSHLLGVLLRPSPPPPRNFDVTWIHPLDPPREASRSSIWEPNC